MARLGGRDAGTQALSRPFLARRPARVWRRVLTVGLESGGQGQRRP